MLLSTISLPSTMDLFEQHSLAFYHKQTYLFFLITLRPSGYCKQFCDIVFFSICLHKKHKQSSRKIVFESQQEISLRAQARILILYQTLMTNLPISTLRRSGLNYSILIHLFKSLPFFHLLCD